MSSVPIAKALEAAQEANEAARMASIYAHSLDAARQSSEEARVVFINVELARFATRLSRLAHLTRLAHLSHLTRLARYAAGKSPRTMSPSATSTT